MALYEGVGDRETWIDDVEVAVMARKNIASDFDEFLEEQGIPEVVTVKRCMAYPLAEKMDEVNSSRAEMARREATSRSAPDRLLDPDNASVTLQTLQSAVRAPGGRLKIELDFQRYTAT